MIPILLSLALTVSRWRCDSCGLVGPVGEVPVQVVEFECLDCGAWLRGYWSDPRGRWENTREIRREW